MLVGFYWRCFSANLCSHGTQNSSSMQWQRQWRCNRISRRSGGRGVWVVAKEATIAPFPSKEGTQEQYAYVVVGGGISRLSTAQALLNKYTSTVNKLLVTEANERVSGNIISLEKDGYLWEEGPNNFQPMDVMLTLVVRLCDSHLLSCIFIWDLEMVIYTRKTHIDKTCIYPNPICGFSYLTFHTYSLSYPYCYTIPL